MTLTQEELLEMFEKRWDDKVFGRGMDPGDVREANEYALAPLVNALVDAQQTTYLIGHQQQSLSECKASAIGWRLRHCVVLHIPTLREGRDKVTPDQKVEAVLRCIVKAADEHSNRQEEHEWYLVPPGYLDAARDVLEQLDKERADVVV